MLRMGIFSVAYGINDYESYRKDGQPPSNYDETKEKIVWETKPPEMVAFQDHGAWDIPEVSFTQCHHLFPSH